MLIMMQHLLFQGFEGYRSVFVGAAELFLLRVIRVNQFLMKIKIAFIFKFASAATDIAHEIPFVSMNFQMHL
jgi:hypothetical protein